MANIDDMAAAAYAISKNNGFWDGEVDIHFLLSKLALIHSEVSEVLEALRKEKGSEEVVLELSDIFIRLVDFYEGAKQAGWIDTCSSLGNTIDKKMSFNASRPRKHGNLA